MANKYYAAGGERAAKVNDLFAAIAPRYDLINDLQSFGLHRHWKRRLVQLADPRPGLHALDLCCGTGDVALALAARGATVAALDFSAPMLAVARQRLARAPRLAGAVQYYQGDALQLPFPNGRFDVATISYGLRNLADLPAGLREMQRVTKPGGHILVLDFGKPDNSVWRNLYFTYLRLCVPVFGRLFCGDSATHAYILESLLHYPGQRGVAASLEALGCRDVRIVNFLGGVTSINVAQTPPA
jgi:demethylmenaquinone methyltransferase/2-methoxy-6-polyprenyl-1,4-benzoquinol methylase